MLKETNYKIVVEASPGGCKLHLPIRKMAPIKKSRTVQYEMLHGGGVDITGGVDSYWICPDYVTRTSIYMDILKYCREYEYSPLAIIFLSEECGDCDSILQILAAPEGVNLETELTALDLAQSLFQNNTIESLIELKEQAEHLNILPGFEFLVQNFINKI